MTDTKELDELRWRFKLLMDLAEPYMNREGKGLDEDWQEFIAEVQNTEIEMRAYISKHYISKEAVERAIGLEPQYKDGLMIMGKDGEDVEIISPSRVRNQLRQQIRKELEL